MISIVNENGVNFISVNGEPCGKIIPCEGAADSFTELECGAWKWHRKTAEPTDSMRMELLFLGEPTFTMVPCISYNGNGWGTMPEYIGDRDTDGTPWSWASHRVTIPSCTYSENEKASIALMSEPNDNCACSLYSVEGGKLHVVIFPEEEKPRTLQRHFWNGPFQGTMEPRCDFEAIIQVVPSDGTKHRYKHLMDFAWRYYGHDFDIPMTTDELERYSIAYARFLYEEEPNGLCAFTNGSEWHKGITGYRKQEHRYQIGWVGQSASLANAMIWHYKKTGCERSLKMGIAAHDSWIKFATVKPGLLRSSISYEGLDKLDYSDPSVLDPLKYGEDTLESLRRRVLAVQQELKNPKPTPPKKTWPVSDACNLGTCAEGYFEGYDLLKTIDIDKPEYLQTAMEICDFALASQDENGCFAKSWDNEGNVWAKKGTIGCFLILPLLNAYVRTNDKRYLDGAERAFAFYYKELEDNGFTTAGALDTYSIDKESASPLLRCSLKLYEVTGDKKYVAQSEKIGWYLCTWMMHFTVEYPDGNIIKEMGYDTFGSTSVSTPHTALDQYALRDVISFRTLAELTGNIQWRERALALWCNANQCVSDGTLYINGRLRPAGGQDEAVFHTRWGRAHVPPFTPSQWLPAWPCAFRLENLRWLDDTEFFNEGLHHIEGKIEH
ncbi:MAG: hypothetical protein IJN63_10200 [Clostridia bacterium]|nr:hypothetical protein [Clostridia bacterium]